MSNSHIAKRYGLSHRKTVEYHMKKLEQGGWINIDKENRKGKTNIITLTIKAKAIFDDMESSWNDTLKPITKKSKRYIPKSAPIDWLQDYIDEINDGDDSNTHITVISNALYDRDDIGGYDIVMLADIIQLLNRYPSMSISKKATAKKMGIDRATVSRSWHRLEQGGWIKMQQGKNRKTIIELTGKAMIATNQQQQKMITRANKQQEKKTSGQSQPQTKEPKQTTLDDQATARPLTLKRIKQDFPIIRDREHLFFEVCDDLNIDSSLKGLKDDGKGYETVKQIVITMEKELSRVKGSTKTKA